MLGPRGHNSHSPAAPGAAQYDPDRERFDKFFESWIVEQERYLQDLLAAAQALLPEDRLRRLVEEVVHHYEHYYRNKSRSADRDVTAMFSPSWTSTLEDAFLWIGGWRPSAAFHLLFSKSGIQLNAQLDAILSGVAEADLGCLSAEQLGRVDRLQQAMIREEREVSEEHARVQEAVADVTMVELSNAAAAAPLDEVEKALAAKSEGLGKVLERADDLRLRTLRGLVEIQSPIQAVHFLIAAAELHLSLREWGQCRDQAAGISQGQS